MPDSEFGSRWYRWPSWWKESKHMVNALILLWGFAAVAAVIVLLDWLGRRKDRQSRNRAA